MARNILVDHAQKIDIAAGFLRQLAYQGLHLLKGIDRYFYLLQRFNLNLQEIRGQLLAQQLVLRFKAQQIVLLLLRRQRSYRSQVLQAQFVVEEQLQSGVIIAVLSFNCECLLRKAKVVHFEVNFAVDNAATGNFSYLESAEIAQSLDLHKLDQIPVAEDNIAHVQLVLNPGQDVLFNLKTLVDKKQALHDVHMYLIR